MRRPSEYLVGVIAVTVALTSGLAPGAAASPPGGVQGADEGFGAKSTTVTLITGDRVDLDAKGRVTQVRPAKGREHLRMLVRREQDRTYVIPTDAMRLVGNGTVDRRLFEVTGLVEAQYDDAHRDGLPLILAYPKSAAKARAKAEVKADVTATGAKVERNLAVLNAQAVSAPKNKASDVWRALTAGSGKSEARIAATGISRVWLDGRREMNLDRSVPQIGAPTAWAAGYQGDGVKVAVIDTGVDQTHPDLAGVEVAEKDFSGSGSSVDHIGHGTHVASTIAGSGAKSSGKYKGVAPKAKILDAKVFDDRGGAFDSSIIAAMQWASDEGAKVANMSLGGDDHATIDPLEEAVDSLSESSGILFVVSAGNSGPASGSINSPGSAAAALTVGAVDREDDIAPFSSAGPTADGSLKPDITAPGVDIVAAKATDGQLGTPAGDGYVAMSGTSMAAPHVAGAAAVLSQQHPDWTGERIKQALTASAKPTPGLTAYQQGAGRTDVAKAITQTVVTEQSSVGFGIQRWSPSGAEPVTRNVTYRNDGAESVTLDLKVEATGPGGKAVPDGLFTTDARQVTVAPRATANVALTADTRVSDQYGDFSGALVATAAQGGQSVRTAFVITREEESYDVTTELLDGNGDPAEATVDLFGLGPVPSSPGAWSDDGKVTIRAPKGDYMVDAMILTPADEGESDVSELIQRKLRVTEDTKLVFDGRDAKPLDIGAPEAANTVGAMLGWTLVLGDGTSLEKRIHMDSLDGFSTASVGEEVPDKLFQARISTTMTAGSTLYNLLYTRDSSMFDGFTHRATRSELALINVEMGAPAKNKLGSIQPAWWENNSFVVSGLGPLLPLPTASKQYVTTPPGFQWGFGAGQVAADVPYNGEHEVLFVSDGGRRTYKAGGTYDLTLNVGVFSPTVKVAQRYKDQALVCLPLFSDSAGRSGFSADAEATTVVTVDGVKTDTGLDDNDCRLMSGLPEKRASYTVSTDVSRKADIAGVSTRIQAAWTFMSAWDGGDDVVDLPLSSLSFAPKLSLDSTAKADAKLTVPLVVRGYAADKGVKSLTIEASYDGGNSWKEAPVTTANGKSSVTLDHPASARSVSLKGALTDAEGNSYKLTVFDAYLLK
ncbi:S8 family peptidase [Streptomyces sp. NPDC050263]|uniref:S8 family peptidase n=1 Tax=Streptomyces sp. NPDC050263 TaxID=3155037 RepID=UPI00343A6019